MLLLPLACSTFTPLAPFCCSISLAWPIALLPLYCFAPLCCSAPLAQLVASLFLFNLLLRSCSICCSIFSTCCSALLIWRGCVPLAQPIALFLLLDQLLLLFDLLCSSCLSCCFVPLAQPALLLFACCSTLLGRFVLLFLFNLLHPSSSCLTSLLKYFAMLMILLLHSFHSTSLLRYLFATPCSLLLLFNLVVLLLF